MAMACVLTIWAGANLWSCIFRWGEIISDDYPSRSIGIFLSILFTLLPLVVAIYLFWTVVVGPDDPVALGNTREPSHGKKTQSGNRK